MRLIYVGDQAKQQMQLVQVAASLELQLKSGARATWTESHMFGELMGAGPNRPQASFPCPCEK